MPRRLSSPIFIDLQSKFVILQIKANLIRNNCVDNYVPLVRELVGSTMLRVDIQSAPPVVTLVCSGRLVLGVEAETLRCMTTSRPEHDVQLEMSRVNRIDAAGLGLLVELHHWARQRAASLTITNPLQAAYRLLSLTSLDRVLQIAGLPSDNDARESDEWQTMTA